MKKKILFGLTLCLSIAAIFRIYYQSQIEDIYIWISLPDNQGNWHRIRTDITPQPSSANVTKAMEYLCHGITENGLSPVFPKEIEYYGITIQGGYAVEVNFKEGYLKMSEIQRGLCEIAMIRSFTSFPGITKLYLYEEGIPLSAIGTSSVLGMVVEDTYLSFEESLQKTVNDKVSLYFYDSGKGKLVAEKQVITRKVYEPKGKVILTALMKGSKTQGLSSLLSETMRINDVKIRNQVCYVDFSQDFVKEYADMGMNRRLMIYSIVNTLTELEEVEYVQFLINGENPEKYSETDNIKTLFRKNHVYVE